MFENGYYPPGAEHDPNAPYNQSDPNPVDVDCYVSCSLSKNVTLYTSDYLIVEDSEDKRNFQYDYSNCNFNYEYHRRHYDIIELLEQLEVFLKGAIEDLEIPCELDSKEEKAVIKATLHTYKQMLRDCQGWTLDEEEIVEA